MVKKQRAAIYCRISRDPEGLRAGVERQQEDCEALARRNGYRVVEVYVDNDIGASTLSKKARPAFDAMMAAAKQGHIDVIVAYSNSRLTRRLAELEGLIQLFEQHGTIITTVVSGQDDLSTADGRMVARIKASVDAAEAERTGERIRRAFLERAKKGATCKGERPFGWQPDKIHIEPTEAAEVRKAAEDIISGVPLRTVARDWNERGITSTRGNPWTHSSVRTYLQRRRLIGETVHQGKPLMDSTGAPVKGEWEPILTRETFDKLQAAFRRNTRGGQRPGRREYLLTGILRCGICGARMFGSRMNKNYGYTCQHETAAQTHNVTIQGPRTDELVLSIVKARLAHEVLQAPEPPDPAEAMDAALDRVNNQVAELMGAYRAGTLSAAIVFPQVEELEAQRDELQRERMSRAEVQPRPALVSVDELDDVGTERQRAIIGTIFESIVVAPAGRRGEPYNPDRLTYVWKTA